MSPVLTTSGGRGRAPQPKIQAAGVGGAVAVVIIGVLDGAGVHLAPEVASAVATLLSFGAGYLKA